MFRSKPFVLMSCSRWNPIDVYTAFFFLAPNPRPVFSVGLLTRVSWFLKLAGQWPEIGEREGRKSLCLGDGEPLLMTLLLFTFSKMRLLPRSVSIFDRCFNYYHLSGDKNEP